MTAKDVKFGDDARARMVAGVNILANAVKVTPEQFPRIHGLYKDVLKTLDVEEEYDLFISQTPIVNAGAYGMEKPFIILNSGTIVLLTDEELAYILGHELGHRDRHG